MIAIQTNMPIDSSACQTRGRSRYSHCWANSGPFAQRDAVDRQRLAHQAADDHQDDGAEQHVDQHGLLPGLPPGDEGRQEDPRGQEPRRGPEQGQLHVPGAGQVVREQLGEVEAEEAQDVGPVVLGRRPQQRLDQEQGGDGEEEPGRRALGRGQRHLPRLTERDRRGLRAVPADLRAPPPVDREQDPGAAEQDDQRQHAPDHHVRRRAVVHPRLRRPVVRVGVAVAGPLGRRRPRGPGEEGRHLADLGRVADHPRDQPVLVESSPKNRA